MKQDGIATRTLNINTSAMKQNKIATGTTNIYTSAMKQNKFATETFNICTSAIKQELAKEALHIIIKCNEAKRDCSQITFTLNHRANTCQVDTLCHCMN